MTFFFKRSNQAMGLTYEGTQSSMYANLKTSQHILPEVYEFVPKKKEEYLPKNPTTLGYDIDYSMADINSQIVNLLATDELTRSINQQYEVMDFTPQVNVQKHMRVNGILRGTKAVSKLTTGTMTNFNQVSTSEVGTLTTSNNQRTNELIKDFEDKTRERNEKRAGKRPLSAPSIADSGIGPSTVGKANSPAGSSVFGSATSAMSFTDSTIKGRSPNTSVFDTPTPAERNNTFNRAKPPSPINTNSVDNWRVEPNEPIQSSIAGKFTSETATPKNKGGKKSYMDKLRNAK